MTTTLIPPRETKLSKSSSSSSSSSIGHSNNRMPHIPSSNRATRGRCVSSVPAVVGGEIPFVSPDGGVTRFYADRFYLDAPTEEWKNDATSSNSSVGGDKKVCDDDGGIESTRSSHCHSSNHIIHHNSMPPVEYHYCNKCGEKLLVHPSVNNNNNGSSNSSHHWSPLFDRSKLINSLDLAAAIIATFSIGDLEYLSKDFPRLFPPPNLKKKCTNSVPTLFLHGQRGFDLENWSCRGSKIKKWSSTSSSHDVCDGNKVGKATNHHHHLHDDERRTSVDDTMREVIDHEPMEEPRGCGECGNECSTSHFNDDSSTTIHLLSSQENISNLDENTMKCPTSSLEEVKHPCLTYDSHQLILPRTPMKSLVRKSKSKRWSTTTAAAAAAAAAATNNNQTAPIKNETDPSNSKDSTMIRTRIVKNTISSSTGTDDTSHVNDVKGKKSPSNETFAPNDHGPISNCCSNSSSSAQTKPKIDVNNNFVQQIRNSILLKDRDDEARMVGWGGVRPATVFGGEVFFTQIHPRWRPTPTSPPLPPHSSTGKRKRKLRQSTTTTAERIATGLCSDQLSLNDKEDEENDLETTTRAGGVHHPKLFLLFETSGSLVVIVSTSNLTSQQTLDGSWVQRFEPKDSPFLKDGFDDDDEAKNDFIDYGMPSDFGAILTDFLTKQSDAAALGGMLPDVFLRRYVPGLSSGLSGLTKRYRFHESQVHLVSTVPGDYASDIPKNIHRGLTTKKYKPRICYGPQRVAFILSRILNNEHIRHSRSARAAYFGTIGGCRMEADTPWFPPSLVRTIDRLVIQPTSLGGNWTRHNLEVVVQSYLRPHWELPSGTAESGVSNEENEDGPLGVVDILWPSMECIIDRKRRSSATSTQTVQTLDTSCNEMVRKETAHFLSSLSFSMLDRSCLSRLSLFTFVPNNPTSTSIHFKSICRLLRLTSNSMKCENKVGMNNNVIHSQHHQREESSSIEYLSWFMLTSACLSQGAQGRPTPHADPATDCTSYMNFELGILFCSRLMGDNVHDRIYVSDPERNSTSSSVGLGCQCGKGSRWYKSRFPRSGRADVVVNNNGGIHLDHSGFLECVRKVYLPVPYQLRPLPYRSDPDSDLMDYTPYMHDIPVGTECVGNMKLTPFGRRKMMME